MIHTADYWRAVDRLAQQQDKICELELENEYLRDNWTILHQRSEEWKNKYNTLQDYYEKNVVNVFVK